MRKALGLALGGGIVYYLFRAAKARADELARSQDPAYQEAQRQAQITAAITGAIQQVSETPQEPIALPNDVSGSLRQTVADLKPFQTAVSTTSAVLGAAVASSAALAPVLLPLLPATAIMAGIGVGVTVGVKALTDWIFGTRAGPAPVNLLVARHRSGTLTFSGQSSMGADRHLNGPNLGDGNIFAVDRDGVKHHITSPTALKTHFGWRDVIGIPQPIFDALPTGAPVTTSPLTFEPAPHPGDPMTIRSIFGGTAIFIIGEQNWYWGPWEGYKFSKIGAAVGMDCEDYDDHLGTSINVPREAGNWPDRWVCPPGLPPFKNVDACEEICNHPDPFGDDYRLYPSGYPDPLNYTSTPRSGLRSGRF